MTKIKHIPISYNGGSSFYVEPHLIKDEDENKEYVAILKSDLDRLNETEKWREIQTFMITCGMLNEKLALDCIASDADVGKITFLTTEF